MDWADGLDLQIYDSAKHEILLYFGCTASYDSRAQSIARAIVEVLRAADVSFGILGEDEPCCGEAVLRLGHSPYFQDVAQHAVEIFKKFDVRKLITLSPHCHDVFKNHYPQINQSFEPLHYTEYIADLIKADRLALEGSLSSKISFHDPCLLGRVNGITDPPRAILGTVPDAHVIEMPHSGPDTLCCGGGGGRMWMETPPGERFSDLRIQEALDVGADIIATACPLCISCLEDSIGSMGVTKLKVRDIAEIAQMALGQESKNDVVEE
jgi:Fe-S oxidoreductase